jgi:hypothetical protein
VNSRPFVAGRGETYCRGCLGERLFSAIDLGYLPIANELLKTSEGEIEKFPLHLRICTDCGLGQVADVVTPERIFRDYRYLSSMSSTFLQHASDFVTTQMESLSFQQSDWVLEIASNDGYLLRNFLPHGIKVLGVEPAENVVKLSRSLGIDTISEFFSYQLALDILQKNGFPKLIIANNVLAHVPDLIDFLRGLAVLCGPDTKISIENPPLSNILVGMQFDTIYHEHYSYLSASSVARLSKIYGLHLYKVEQLKIHGGSNRFWLQKFKVGNVTEDSVEKAIKSEVNGGIFTPKNWMKYSESVRGILSDFHLWLSEAEKNRKKIYGYGAAAKASTILNLLNMEISLITAIADVSPEKQTRFMPPHGIEIISLTELVSKEPTDVIIFPWNIKKEIAGNLLQILSPETRLWCAIPFMHEVKTS